MLLKLIAATSVLYGCLHTHSTNGHDQNTSIQGCGGTGESSEHSHETEEGV